MIARLRRNSELSLILLGAAIAGGAYTLATLGTTASIPADIGPFFLIVVGLFVAAHLAVRRLAPGADGMLLPLAGLLNGLGYVFIARLDTKLAGLQATWTALGIVAFIATLAVIRRPRDLERYRYTFLLLGIGLLMLPLVPKVGQSINGARIWVSIGPVNFQPGEFAKIALAIFFAAYLVEKRELLAIASWPRFRPVLPDPKHLGPVIAAWALSIMVMTAEKDLGSSLLFFALFMVMLWVATERARYLAVGAVMFSAASYFAWKTFAHVQQRVDGWLNPWAHANGPGGYQIIQGWYAMAWGGIAGTGLGLGTPTRIPEVKNDFIFAGIAEELGLLGATALLVTFVLMIGAGLRIAVRAESAFDKLLATGLTALLGIQSFIIIAGVTRLLPLTGVTLPFVSYGGSSLLANYVLIALLMRISDQTNRREELRERESGGGVNKQIRSLGIALLVMFTALFAQLNYIQVFRAPSLNDDKGNNRKIIQDFSRPRGTIVSADGVVLAKSIASKDQFKYQRVYPEGELFGHVTGYFNFNFGSTGIEASYADELAGNTPELDMAKLSDLFVDRDEVGNVNISVRKDVQEVARQALAGRAGTVVAIDPKTGAILAFYSNTAYDPNALAAHDASAANAKKLLEAAPSKPLLPRMYAETFFPGSTFKVVTGSIGLQTGKVTLTAPSYPVQTGYKIDFTDRPLSNFGGESCGGPLPEILAVSCNSAFAAMGTETIGTAGMVSGAEAFGFNSKPPIDLPAPAASVFPTDFPKDQGNGPIARASIGQGDTKATPLQMALVAASIANGGVMMTPHLMATITDDQNKTVKTYAPRAWKTPLTPPDAALMRQAMLGVVQSGTATGLQIPGMEVGGKTGTAQLGTNPPKSHASIVGFAGPPGQDPKVAIAVIVEAQDGAASEATGGRIAAPVAQAVMAKILADG